MLLPAVERCGPVSGPGHAVTELQGHGGRPGVRSVVSRESVVLGRRLVAVVAVVTVPSTHQTARAQAVHQGVALGELLVHPAAPVVVGRAAVTVVTLRLLPARSDTLPTDTTTASLHLPQNDRLLADVEVVFTEFVLHDDGNARRQSLCPIHVQLACLPLPRAVIGITVKPH